MKVMNTLNGEAPYDLIMKLCSFSNSVKVLAPQSLADAVAGYHKAAYEQYQTYK